MENCCEKMRKVLCDLVVVIVTNIVATDVFSTDEKLLRYWVYNFLFVMEQNRISFGSTIKYGKTTIFCLI